MKATIGNATYEVRKVSDEFYGEYYGAINVATGRPHMMRETEAEAIADLQSLISAQAAHLASF